MKIGYVRVSTAEQNTLRQEVMMGELGVDEVYIEKQSGKNMNRPELQKLLTFVRKGDIVIVESISRFARNTKDLLELIEQLKKKEVDFISKKENIDTKTPSGKFMLTVFAAVSELEREYILQRQKEGILLARQQNKYKGRKPIQIDNFDMIYKKWQDGEVSAVTAMKTLNIKKSTFYRRVKQRQQEAQQP